MVELTRFSNYQEFKNELNGELRKSAEGFVRIGYLLKVARDTDVLKESGYESVTEFAYKEYGLDKSQVSRFISINERFANGGERLLPQYEEYGYAKLTIMLQIPEEITRELTPAYTKAEIQAVKEEVDEEKKVSDLEVLMEGKKDEEESTLFRTLKQLGEDNPELWTKLWEVRVPFLTWDEVGRIMAPSGDKNYSVRIMGMGRVMMTFKDGEDAVTITSVRTLESETYTRQQVADELVRVIGSTKECEDAGKAWEEIYKKPWPLGKVAPGQPVEPQKEKAKEKPAKKESKVSKAKTPEKPKKTSTETTLAAVVNEEEETDGIRSRSEQSKGDADALQNPANGIESGTAEPLGEGGAVELPDGAGGTGEAVISGRSERDEVQGLDEGDGASEGGGREADHERLVEEAWYGWMDLRQAMPPTRFVITAKAKELYNLTIKLAAALEKLMNEGGKDED